MGKEKLKNNVYMIDTNKIVEEYVSKVISNLKSSVVFYFPNESVKMKEVLKVVEIYGKTDKWMTDNRVVVLNTSKFSRDELSILSYNISRLNVFDLVSVYENGKLINKDLFKRKTQSIPYDEDAPTMSDQDFYKLIDELEKSNPKTSKIKRKNYLVSTG